MSKRKEIPDVMSQLQGLGPAPAPEPEEETLTAPAPPPSRREAGAAVRRKNRTPRSRLVGRATYDIGQDLKQAIYRESVELGVPASQLAKYLLLYAWDFYLREEIPSPTLLRSDSPKFRNTIDFE
jgi:hypothetical protein